MTSMLVEALLEAIQSQPAAEAVRDQSRVLTFRQLGSLAAAIRRFVAKNSRQDCVGVMLPASAAFNGAFFGTLWAGRIVVPLNFLLSPAELTDIVRDAGLDLILSTRHFAQTTDELPVRTVCIEDMPIKRLALAAKLAGHVPAPTAGTHPLAVLLYTSGTTGRCKGVELTAEGLRANSDAVIQSAALREDDRFLCVLPPFHVFGLTAGVLIPVVRQIAAHMIPRFNPAAVLRAIAEFSPNIMMAIPSMYGALMRTKSADPNALKHFRLLISGGEPLPDVIADGFRDRFGVELLEGYGLTETSPVISLNTPQCNKRGSVGKPLASVTVRIVDPDAHDLPTGQDGEIVVRGPSVMRGYRNRPDATAAVLTDGWFRTGDIGQVDEDGFLFITGRVKDMMIVGGENVFPREIESVLEQHPHVEEAAVIGVPDASRGEVPLAFVLLRTLDEGEPTFDDPEIALRSFARKHLAGYKVPRQIRVVEDLPRGPTGKVQKHKLREQLNSSTNKS